MTMIQQDVAAAVGRLTEITEGAGESFIYYGRNSTPGTSLRNDLRLILSALQQRSGDERERVARIIDPVRWRRFDRHPPYAAHIPREQQIEWTAALQDSLAKADAILGGQSCP